MPAIRPIALLALLPLVSACGLAGPAGNASSGLTATPPTAAVQAAFAQRSYAPGSVAVLRLRGAARPLRVQMFHAGAARRGPMQGAPVSTVLHVDSTAATVALSIGEWPSGLYYARVSSPRGTWFAPFVLRPARLGAHRVAVVLPTNTWQAYNYEDDDSWYLDSSVHTIDLGRPYVEGGVPPHYHGYDRGFLRWLALRHAHADFFSDDDLDRVASGDALARAYDLIVFPGHEEYVTEHELDVVTRYRNLGGNLAFLSSNNFFYKVSKHGELMDGRLRWRDLGRPEASLVGIQYVDWNHDRYPNTPFSVVGRQRAPWLFRGTGLEDGSTFGVYGIEIDAVAPSSPRAVRVVARISGIFGRGKSAEMTYYETPAGAKVFAAGVMNFGGSALWPGVRTMVANIWRHLATP